MKVLTYSLLFFITCIAFSACSNSEDVIPESTSIIGKWQLIETYADPGDGSGKFIAVKSNKTLNFSSTEVRTNEGSFCSNLSTDTYSLSESEYEGTIYTLLKYGSCDMAYSYVIAGNTLTIYYNCIEGCGERYKRIK